MIPKLHTKDGIYIGDLTDCLKGIAIEERNGMLEAEITYQLFSPYWDELIRGNIFTADVNDKIKNQQFRIYKVGKTIKGVFNVYAKHISYDAQRDMIEGLDIQNQSCEYCLNMIFRNSQFSQKFRGYSDIVNAQNYKIGSQKLLTAIAGAKGSIIDTFGTGAEILRDNYDFYVLSKRGHDNGVTIEYSKNMTGLDYTEDEEGLITRIKAIAKYTPEGGEETEIFTYVDSPKILDYETPFIETIDFSDKFDDGEIPTVEKLEILGEKYFKDNKCDFVKFNYKISFIPLSKCIGYENIEDKIELCDTVGIKDYRYNLDTKAKVIKTTYDFLRERYESMEVGEPKTTLGDIITDESNEGVTKDEVKDIVNKTPSTNYPNTLPTIPTLEYKLYGFSNIELSWTYENKVYYNYELYASKTKDFIPNTFDLIHAGQTSSFLFQAKPNETWYFKVCAINTHGNRTEFSQQVVVTTKKVDDFENYFSTLAVSNLVTSIFSTDYMEAGIIKGNWIDAKLISVTDGNGKRTFEVKENGDTSINGKIESDSVILANGGIYTNQAVRGRNPDGTVFVGTYGDVVLRSDNGEVYLQCNNEAKVTAPSNPNLFKNFRANDIYANNDFYATRDATINRNLNVNGEIVAVGSLTSNSNIHLGNNGLINVRWGYGVIRVNASGQPLYLQCNDEVKCTKPADASTYTSLRALNLMAQNKVYANGVALTSNKEYKKNIEDYTEDALNEICTTPIRQYHLLNDLDNEMKRIGIILQEAPVNAIDLEGEGVDLYQMVTMAWKAIQQLKEEIEALKGGV